MKIPHLDSDYSKVRMKQWPRALRISLLFVLVIWVVFLLEFLLPIAYFSNRPRTLLGLAGIVSMPFIHGSWSHIINNTLPLFIAIAALFGNYPKSAKKVIAYSVLITGILIWLFARSVNHIGSSGLFYALLSYLFVSGFIKKDLQSVGISIAIAFLYGSMFWGIFPGQTGISWESHLFGMLSGILLAIKTRHQDLPVLKDWHLDDDLEK